MQKRRFFVVQGMESGTDGYPAAFLTFMERFDTGTEAIRLARSLNESSRKLSEREAHPWFLRALIFMAVPVEA